jgi:sodium-dependent dicarboxylate transporter 2/3/5
MPDTQHEQSHLRFDRLRGTIGLFLGPAVFLLILALPLDLSPQAHRLAAVFGLVIVYWVSEAIPLAATALLGPALCVPLGVASARDAFSLFGHPIIFLFMGSFLIAKAMGIHKLDRRIALFVLSRRWVGESPARIMVAFGAISAFLSMWMSNTATTAMMLPIGLGVLAALSASSGVDSRRGWGYSTGLMLMIAYSCNVGGIATPVGTPPNLIAIGMAEDLLGKRLSFIDWMGFALPISIVLFGFVFFILWRLYPAPKGSLAGVSERIRAERETLGSWSAGEKASLAAFLLAVSLWTLPGIVGLFFGAEHGISATVRDLLPNEGPSAIIAASLLFVLPVDWNTRRFALDWKEASRIDWGTILLFGGGLSLGSMAFSTGLAEALGGSVLSATGGLPLVIVALLGLFLANIMTEFMSNTATANLLVPMFLALAGEATGSTMLPALAVTLGCSLAFCFPVATPPNAIVYGSGHVPLVQMIRAGVLLDLGCGVLAWGVLVLMVG